ENGTHSFAVPSSLVDGRAEMNVSSSKPRVAVTIGDPAGIGPEVVLKALSSPDLQDLAHWIVVGDRIALEKTAAVDCGMMADVRTMHDVALIKSTDLFLFGVLIDKLYCTSL